MQVLALLSLTLVLVSTRPANHTQKILEEILMELNMTLSQDLSKTLVPDVFHKHKCKPEDLCKAKKIFEEYTNIHKHSKISRLLHAYTQEKNCTLTDEGNRLELSALWKDLRHCFQKLYPEHIRNNTSHSS